MRLLWAYATALLCRVAALTRVVQMEEEEEEEEEGGPATRVRLPHHRSMHVMSASKEQK